MNIKPIKNKKEAQRIRRRGRIRSRVVGSAHIPRLSVSRSNKHISAQLIDDSRGVTLAAVSDVKDSVGTKVERASKIGTKLAKTALALKIKKVVFDRGGYLYAGRVKALAESARTGGLEF